jgi:2-polyprenyl-3-methyl-5-hydroxy-6-metoxy-1,4-benzoquinol methylase
MTSRYHQRVDPYAPNNAHAFAVELVGWNRRVLELGAASGHVTEALVARGCTVTAVELDPEAAADLARLTEQVVVGDLNDPGLLAQLDGEFDVVLAGDVLEHLLRPHEVLARASRLLAPTGQVVVSLPHVGHADVRHALMQGSWNYGAWGLLDETHARFFTLASIKRMVQEAGLVITELRRVRIPAFETELGVDRETVPTEVLELTLADPEAETYQFVFAAALDNGDYRLRRTADRKHELEVEVRDLRIAREALDAELGRLTDELDSRDEQRRGAQHRTEALVAELARSRTDLRLAHDQIRRVDGSVSWQLFLRGRRRVFRTLGGERSVLVGVLQASLRTVGHATGVSRAHPDSEAQASE